MRFSPTKLNDAMTIEIEPIEDNRGFFARTFCQKEMQEAGISDTLVQCSTSYTKKKGTIRGLHFQIPPVQETKIVRVTAGSIYDVIIDLRPSSSTFLKWIGVELSAKKRNQLFIPPGFGHGFQTLENDIEVFYQMNMTFCPDTVRGIMYNDPFFNISWPFEKPILSEKDMSYAPFDLEKHKAYYNK